MKRFLKKVFSKLLFLILLCLVVFFAYIHRDWFKHQYMKMQGVYFVYKGDQAYSQDNMAKTIDYYQKGLKLFPGHYQAWFNLGNIYAVYEDYYSAVEAYKNAINCYPAFIEARMNLGIVYSEDLGFFDEAIEQFDIITKTRKIKLWFPFVYSNVKSIRGNRGIANFNKGVAYRKKAMYLPYEKKYLAYQYLGDAIEAYTASLKLLKKNYDIYYNRAVAHHLRGEYKEAGLDYCKAINLQPSRFEAHYNMAVLLRHLNHYQESIKELEKAALLILESSESSELQTSYIFNLLNEVTRKLITSEEYYVNKVTDEPFGSASYTYINGKIVPNEDFDRAMMQNLKTCAGYTYFNGNEDIEEE